MIINRIYNFNHTDKNGFFLIAGPCVIEGEDITINIASVIRRSRKSTNTIYF